MAAKINIQPGSPPMSDTLSQPLYLQGGSVGANGQRDLVDSCLFWRGGGGGGGDIAG